jgi:hypothetical protein
VLERAGTYAAVRERALSALRDGNEDPDAFRVASPYRVIECVLDHASSSPGSARSADTSS